MKEKISVQKFKSDQIDGVQDFYKTGGAHHNSIAATERVI